MSERKLPRPYIKEEKADERDTFVKAMSNQAVSIENTLEVACSKSILYYEEKRDIRQAIKRLNEVISRIR